MKFIIKTILIALSVLVVSFFLPWWGMCIPAFLIPVFFVSPQKRKFSGRTKELSGLSFLSGLIAGSSVWGIAAIVRDLGNDSILSSRIAELVTQQAEPVLAILITALLGGLLCAFPAMTGAYFGLMIKGEKR